MKGIPNGHPNARTGSHVRAEQQEAEWAARGGGKVVAEQSGIRKGDVEGYNGYWRLECKTTSKKSFSVTREMIEKIEDAALSHGEHPAMIVEFNDGQRKQCEIAIVPTWVLDTLRMQSPDPDEPTKE